MWNEYFEQELAHLKDRGLIRRLQVLPEPGGELVIEGRRVLNFCSNDYLALGRDRRVKEAAKRAVERYGCASTASRLLAGHLRLHEEIEADLAAMMGKDAALVFGSGFLTNLGVMSSVAGPTDEVFSDTLNHASLIDGIRLSRAACHRYQHNDMDHLEGLLKQSKGAGKRIVVTESVFSMDGDIAPVKALAELCRRYEALFVIDEAHALGIMGFKGRGVCGIPGNDVHPDIVIGTLSKSLGNYGGFAACSKPTREFLINTARSFIFTTGLPPPCIGGAREAVSIVTSEPQLGKELLDRSRWFRDLLVRGGLNIPPFSSHILPVMIGDNDAAVRLSKLLWERGLLIRAIRPPTVPAGTARLRLSMSLALTRESLEAAAGVIVETAREVGVPV